MSDWTDPFDCQQFHELCMDYRGALAGNAQDAYERLQWYCRRVSFSSALRETAMGLEAMQRGLQGSRE